MAAAAAVSPAVSDEEIVAELRAGWAEVSRGYARCWAAMAEVARRTTPEWETAEIAAALTFTRRRADYELNCAQTMMNRLPRVYAALATGELDHHKARLFTDYLVSLSPAQAERITERLVPKAVGWTTSQLAARLLREVQAIDPGYTRHSYEQAVRERGVHGYLDHTGTAVLTGSGLPVAEAAAAAARLEVLADKLRAAGYPATVHQTRADLYLRLLDGTLDGLSGAQILATMLELGPLSPADTESTSTSERHRHPFWAEPDRSTPPAHPVAPERSAPGERCDPNPGSSGQTTRSHPVRYGIEVRVRLSTLLGLDEHPAEVPQWGPIPAAVARDLVAAQHRAEWRIAVVDSGGYLLHGDLTRRRPSPATTRSECLGGVVEIALPESLLGQLPTLAIEHPQWAGVLHGILASWTHRDQARAALDAHPDRRFAHAALRRHVQMRDRSCVGVGCRRRATATELDHTRDHAHGGPTVTTNSGPCCARDHLMKHQGGWTLTQLEAGHFMWISPLGQVYRTRGEPLIPDLPAALPREPNPYSASPGLPWMDEGPILHQPEPPPTRPPPTELPDEPPF